MGILRNQLRSVIEWNPSPAILFERWSENGDEIKNASKLILGPGQGCLFVYEGRVEGIYTDPGMIELRTANIPFVTTIARFMQGFASEHKVALYLFKTSKLLNLRWGTHALIKYEDPKYKMPVGLRAFGNYSMSITDAALFFRDVVAGTSPFLIDDIRDSLNGRIEQPLVQCLAQSKLSYAEIDPNREDIAAALSSKLAAEFSRLGFVLDDFRIQGTSFDDDTVGRINRIADLTAEAHAASSAGVSFVQLEQLSALRDAARNQGAAGSGMGLVAGMNLAGAAAHLPPADGSDPVASLRRLKTMFEQGLITKEDFEAKKTEILAQM